MILSDSMRLEWLVKNHMLRITQDRDERGRFTSIRAIGIRNVKGAFKDVRAAIDAAMRSDGVATEGGTDADH